MGKFIFTSISFSILLLVFGCESKQTDNTPPPPVAQKIKPALSSLPEIGSFNGDTINLHGSFVLFYGPPKNAENTPSEISDFHKVTDILIDSLQQKNNIFSTYTSVNNIRVYNKSTGLPMVIMRSTFTEPVGVIISDGVQSPVIKKGSGTVNEFRELIDKMVNKPS